MADRDALDHSSPVQTLTSPSRPRRHISHKPVGKKRAHSPGGDGVGTSSQNPDLLQSSQAISGWETEMEMRGCRKVALASILKSADNRKGWLKKGYTMRYIDIAGASIPNMQNEFLYSPNVSYVLKPATETPSASEIRVYSDGMLGNDEITKWPRVLSLPRDTHIACVPVAPVFRENYTYAPFPPPLDGLELEKVDILWAQLLQQDFERFHTPLIDDKVIRFTMPNLLIKRFDDSMEYIKTLFNNIPSSYYRNLDRYNKTVTSIGVYFARMDDILLLMNCNVPERFLDLVIRCRDAQRTMLEILGHIILQVVVDPRYSANGSPPVEVLPLLGCVVTSPWDVAWLLKCGVPVWKVSHTFFLKSDTPRIFNSGQNLIEITEMLSLTDFVDENTEVGIPVRVPIYFNSLDERPRKVLKRDVKATVDLPIVLLTRHSGLNVSRSHEEDLIGLMVQEIRNVTRQSQEYPFDHVVVATADSPKPSLELPSLNLTSTIDFPSSLSPPRLQVPKLTYLRQPLFKPKRHAPNKNLFGDLFAKIFVHDKSVLFQPFLFAAGRLGHQTVPWSAVPAAMYIFPPPSVFMKDKAERAERVARWVKLRKRWAGSVFNGQKPDVEPLQTAVWRALLTADKRVDSKRRQTMTVRAQKKSESRDKAIEKANQIRSMFVKNEGNDNAALSASWGGRMFVEGEMADHPDVKQEVFYELHHLNFVADFFSLDAFEMQSMGVNLAERRHKFLRAFGGQTILNLDDLRFPDIWTADIHDRFVRLRPWYELMQDWPRCPPELHKELSHVTLDEMMMYEQQAINLYVTLFASRFFRWPVVPMARPPSLVQQYISQEMSRLAAIPT